MPIASATRRLPFCALVLVVALASCDSPAGPVPVDSVEVTAPAASLIVGETMQAAAVPRDASGAPLRDRPVEWASANPAIASVSGTGVVTAVAAGEVAITATSEGRTGRLAVTVRPVPVAAVTVTLPAPSLIVGETMQAVATPRDAAGNPLAGRAAQWSSSDAAVARVDAAGAITAVAPGEATITARSEGVAGTAILTVLAVPVASVTVAPDTAAVEVGGARQLTATVRDAAGNVLPGRAVVWTSSSEAVARVGQNGVVAGVAPGEATITATSEGRSGTARVTVVAPPPPPLQIPGDVRAERRSRLRARVSWSASAEAAEYRVERRLAGGVWAAIATTSALSHTDETERARGGTYEYRVVALAPGRSSAPSASAATTVPAVRLALIGDSNLAWGKSGATTVAVSYVEGGAQAIDPNGYPDHPKLLSGKIMALRADVEAVNHGISSTRTTAGTVSGKPHALHAIGGVTRFEAEVLGRGYPWTAQGIPRVNAFAPLAQDFGYYALGINDITGGISPTTIRDNIATAIDLWIAAGLPARRLMVATMGPRLNGHSNQANIPVANRLIRELAAEKGVSLVDISALVSPDDGLSWRDAGLHVGDGLHFTETALDLIAAEVVAVMGRAVP